MYPAGSILPAGDPDRVHRGVQPLRADRPLQVPVQLARSLAVAVQVLQTLIRFDLVLLEEPGCCLARATSDLALASAPHEPNCQA